MERPEAYGAAAAVTTGSLVLPKVATRPAAHASCASSSSRYVPVDDDRPRDDLAGTVREGQRVGE